MPVWIVNFFLWFASSRTAHKTVVNILDGVTHKTDNYDDDELVHAIARALEINLPDHNGQPKPEYVQKKEEGMILMPKEELDQIKSSRKKGKPTR